MKYYHDMRALNVLVEQMKQRITDRLAELGRETSVFDAIIPIPPSIQNRPFQPVIEIARRLAEQLSIRFDADLVSKQGDLQPMKNLESYEEKVAHLRQVLKVADTRYAGKRLLVIDDIVDSGATLDTVASLLKTHGAVGHVYVLCATETLMKR
jgi:predicted amidophosphoribosyltransferase